MRVLVIHSRDLDKGSTRFRVVNYSDFLAANGVTLHYVRRNEVTADDLDQADVVLNQKCRMTYLRTQRILRSDKRTLFDFDDAIYTRARKPYGKFTGTRVRRRLRRWLQGADLVTCANAYLAEYAQRYTSEVTVVPMSVDLERWHPAPKQETDTVRIGWAGRPGNLRYLEAIEQQLAEIKRVRPTVEICVYSGARPNFSFDVAHTPFAPGTEAEFCRQLDIGLLPLADTEFTRGKSPIKAIQYLACGVPVVGNVFGATGEIVTHANGIAIESDDQWVAKLVDLVDDAPRRRRLGQAGRAHAVAHHDQRRISQLFLQCLTGN